MWTDWDGPDRDSYIVTVTVRSSVTHKHGCMNKNSGVCIFGKLFKFEINNIAIG
jgi:hypothetical protein